MFTGIIEEIGTLTRVERTTGSCQLAIRAMKVLDAILAGDSIAVNGVCLTVTRGHSDGFVADVMAETMRRTNLESLNVGDRVNLERSLRLGERLGGHIVAGHVDEVGTVIDLEQEDIATLMTVSVSPSLMKYIAVKGSVCVEGVSLTVMDVVVGSNPARTSSFQVSLIPFTKGNTILGLRRVGNAVNVEVDMLARYVESLMNYDRRQSGESPRIINEEFLKTHGFF